jgi:hypothetical protein
MRTFLSFFVLFLLTLFAKGQQNSFSGGLSPDVTVSYTSPKNLQFTGKIESQHFTYQEIPGNGNEWMHTHKATDFQFFLAYPIHPLWKLAGGYQYQLSGTGEHSHRAVQQLSHVQRKEGYRLGHRWRTDQTFYKAEKTQYRLRYRLSAEIALQGQQVDPGEVYLIVSNEFLYEIQDGEDDLENRLELALGRYFSKKQKLEVGLDYRTDQYLREGHRQRLWFTLGWFMQIR